MSTSVICNQGVCKYNHDSSLYELEQDPINKEFEKVKNKLLSIVDEFNARLVSAANESPVPVKIRGMDMASPWFDRSRKADPVQIRIFNGNDEGAGYFFNGLT